MWSTFQNQGEGVKIFARSRDFLLMEKKLAFMFYFCTRGHITKQSGEVKEGMPTLAEILP